MALSRGLRCCQRAFAWVPVLIITLVVLWSYYAYVCELCLSEGRAVRRGEGGARPRRASGSAAPCLRAGAAGRAGQNRAGRVSAELRRNASLFLPSSVRFEPRGSNSSSSSSSRCGRRPRGAARAVGTGRRAKGAPLRPGRWAGGTAPCGLCVPPGASAVGRSGRRFAGPVSPGNAGTGSQSNSVR